MGLKTGRCKIWGATLRGVEAHSVQVEVSVSNGLPTFSIVGMPDASIKESKERIRAALQSCGFVMPASRIVANLAPGSIKKNGSGFDLPIAIAVLIATGQISGEYFDNYFVVGELSLDGRVREVPGILAYALCARRFGMGLLSSKTETQAIELYDVEQKWINSLEDLVNFDFKDAEYMKFDKSPQFLDFKDINGHDYAKRAMQIAACGNHGLLMMGPPGSGKSMLASRMPSILPPLTEQEMLEAAVIHSIAGEDSKEILSGIRPFRHPHHSSSLAGLIGGGNPIKPGEVSLAHQGVLYLDELAEFSPHVMQGIRQPLEDWCVTITRADGTITFPSKFTLIAASNPCPCGYFGDPDIPCKCSPVSISRYQNRIGGPVMDRIDMHVNVSRIPAKNVLSTGQGKDSESMFNEVMNGVEYRKFREEKEIKEGIWSSNYQPKGDDSTLYFSKNTKMEILVRSCNLSDKDFEEFGDLATKNQISGRGIMKILSIARTIADMEMHRNVTKENLFEALHYRVPEGNC